MIALTVSIGTVVVLTVVASAALLAVQSAAMASPAPPAPPAPPETPEEPRTEPNHRNRVVSMIMDSDLVLVDGRVLKNRWGDGEIPSEEAAAVMSRCEGLLVRRFDRDARVLVLETPTQR